MCGCFKSGGEFAGLGWIGGEKLRRRGDVVGRAGDVRGAGPWHCWRAGVTVFRGAGAQWGWVWKGEGTLGRLNPDAHPCQPIKGEGTQRKGSNLIQAWNCVRNGEE